MATADHTILKKFSQIRTFKNGFNLDILTANSLHE